MDHQVVYNKQTEYLFKVLIIGEASTGKTSFIRRYVNQFYSNAYKATVGVDFALKNIRYDKDTIIRLQLWDIAGQERFSSMTRVYYRDAVGAFILFDSNRPSTFESVLRWKNDLDNKVSFRNGSSVPCLLLANKCDLIQKTDQDIDELEKFSSQNNFIGCCYTSPKYDINIDHAVNLLVEEIFKRQNLIFNNNDNGDNNITNSGNIIIDHFNDTFKRGKKSCCT